MTAGCDVLVIGAGVVGLSTAWELGLRGAGVHVVDLDPDGGSGSRAAAGVAIPSLRLLSDPVMYRFAADGRRVLDEDVVAFETGSPAIRRGRGVIRPVRDGAERDRMLRACEPDPAALGRWVDADALAELEPVFGGSPFTGGFHTETGYVVDTAVYLDNLTDRVRRTGGTIILGRQVLEVRDGAHGVQVDTSAGTLTADRLVVAAGAWSGGLPGLPALPVRPLRGQMIELSDPQIQIDHIVSGRTYLCPWRAGALCTGATEEEAGFASHVTSTGMAYLLSRLIRDFPLLGQARPTRTWAGLRSAAQDGRLLLGAYPSTARVFIGAAHGGQGILTGHHTGRMLAGLLDGCDGGVPREFAPNREASL